LAETFQTGTVVTGRTDTGVTSGCGTAGTSRQIVAAGSISIRTEAVAIG